MNGRHDADALIGRLDKMVAAGRFTTAEAERLRSAVESGDLDQVIGEIRSRHVKETLDAAVLGGGIGADEADAILEQVKRGEHPRLPAGLRRRFGPGTGDGSE